MAGPTAGVVFEDSTLKHLTWREMMSDIADQWGDDNFCWVSDSTKFGGRYVGELRPFVGDVYAIDQYYGICPDELTAISLATGLNLTHLVELAAMCNSDEDHQILCEIACRLAERHHGYVDFNRVISEMPCVGLLTIAWTEDGRAFTTQIGSPQACKWWMSQENFRMVK